jgi:hypothetical protein
MRSQEESGEDIDLKVVDQRKYSKSTGSVKQRSAMEGRKKAERIISKHDALKLGRTEMKVPSMQ